jgi:hypothetical protein
MKLSDFIVLSASEKKHTLLHRGVLIAKRQAAGRMVFLFQIAGYYVETFCDPSTRDVETFRIFDTPGPLNPYLEMISIDELMM